MLRATPNLNVFRPADIIETAECLGAGAADQKHRPSVLVLSRQNLPMLQGCRPPGNRSARAAPTCCATPARARDATLHRHRLRGGDRRRRRRAPRRRARAGRGGGLDALLGALRGTGRGLARRPSRHRPAHRRGGGRPARLGSLDRRDRRLRRHDRLRRQRTGARPLPPLRASPPKRSPRRPSNASPEETTDMARITLRQLLDHAAEHGYGVPAFNINNMEQGLAIMEAAARLRRAGHPAGLARRPQLRQRHHACPDDRRAGRDLPRNPDLHAPGPRQRRGHLPDGDPPRLHLGDDGRLAAGRRQDPGELRLQCRNHRAGRRAWHTMSAPRSRASSACSARWRAARARPRTVTAREGALSHDQLLTDPDQAVDFVAAHQGRRAGDRLRHLAWRLQVHAAARRRHPGHARHRGDPRASCPDTHLVMHGSSSVPQALAGPHQPLRRRDAADLRRPGRGDRARHPPRGAQGQHRHRLPHGDDRPVPPHRDRESGRVRPAQVPEAGDGRHARPLPRPAASASAPPATPPRSRSSRWTRWPDATPRASLDPHVATARAA